MGTPEIPRSAPANTGAERPIMRQERQRLVLPVAEKGGAKRRKTVEEIVGLAAGVLKDKEDFTLADLAAAGIRTNDIEKFPGKYNGLRSQVGLPEVKRGARKKSVKRKDETKESGGDTEKKSGTVYQKSGPSSANGKLEECTSAKDIEIFTAKDEETQQAAVDEYCRRCLVMRICRAHGLKQEKPREVWGGLTASQLKRHKRELGDERAVSQEVVRLIRENRTDLMRRGII